MNPSSKLLYLSGLGYWNSKSSPILNCLTKPSRIDFRYFCIMVSDLCYSYVQLIDEKRWYHFDDSHVSPVGEEEIKTSAAYLLFYQRVEN